MGTLTQEETTVPIPMSSDDIAADIVARIAAGEYPPGSMLPSQRDLAQLYSVSPSTAYRIYQMLKKQGVVVGSNGRGMFVAEATKGVQQPPS